MINVERLVTSAVEMYHKEKAVFNQDFNQAISNQDSAHHEDSAMADDPEVNSEKATPLQSQLIAPEEGAGGEKGGNGGGGGGGEGQVDHGEKGDGAVMDDHSVKLSTVGALGEKAYNALTCGTVIDDHLMISILMEELRSHPQDVLGPHLFILPFSAQVIAQWIWMGVGEFPHNSRASQGESLLWPLIYILTHLLPSLLHNISPTFPLTP